MREYFRRLGDHPGLGLGALFTLVYYWGAFSNPTLTGFWAPFLVGTVISLIFPWSIILITNFYKD